MDDHLKRMRLYFLFIIITLILPILFLDVSYDDILHRVYGTTVQATVIRIVYDYHPVAASWHNPVSHNKIYVAYRNAGGDLVEATTSYSINISVDDVIVGRVLPDKPNEVYIEPPLIATILLLTGGICLPVIGVITIIMDTRIRRKNERLKEESRSDPEKFR